MGFLVGLLVGTLLGVFIVSLVTANDKALELHNAGKALQSAIKELRQHVRER